MSCARDWTPPSSLHNGSARPAPELHLYNSLVDAKVPFVPAAGPGSRHVSWYTCGPTVYDSAHLGHARNYLTFDILRRVLEDHFGYDVRYVMNVTDIDDKIILRARRNHLLEAYRATATDPSQARSGGVARDARAALAAAQAKQAKKVGKAHAERKAALERSSDPCGPRGDGRVVAELDTLLAQEEHVAARLAGTLAALEALGPSADAAALLGVAGDVLAEWLDAARGGEVTDPAVFRAHAARYEAEFLADMEALGVRPPTVLTRVSEYLPEVVEFVRGIERAGFAYSTHGSVYFDTAAFSAGHTYGKLAPWSVGSVALAGEAGADGKRHPSDFALWKARKPGEPAWPSPWGEGRPGWHIECSAMASKILGRTLDIHTGGEDLRFPHHDNELAQSEAHYHACGCRQWVNYFLHSGHLGIDGLKMSKSLKNFITIRAALESISARQLRLMFVLQAWERPMTFGDQVLGEARSREKSVRDFFSNVDLALREAQALADAAAGTLPERWEAEEEVLQAALESTAELVHAALCDNINTRGAMDALGDLIKAFNVYRSARGPGSASPPQRLLIRSVASYVSRILGEFGLEFGVTSSAGPEAAGRDETPAVLDAFAAFRDEIRRLAKEGAGAGQVLAACDSVRDGPLVDLGVQLEDRAGGPAAWKREDPAVLRAEQARRAQQAAEAAETRRAARLGRLRRDLDRFEGLAALPSVPSALADRYRFDAPGEPTADAGGAPLDDKALAKARKEVAKQQKIRKPLEDALEKNPDFLEQLRADIAALELEGGAQGAAAAGGAG
ncbi:Cysteine-tRNA ligase, cytoplasmic [Auxenochlorella protothecoides]|uniref:cysteine--tRNA ligase n=1 Tax=Auxenochlorella protothecoides TaxID=3075 RepID=A0A087SGX5_AUXPR|nr:Cysteine-tRNA ligase, cytoplasmic [Auxenochlorella protothecoides]KFM24979.1 Cysteine-tRNA ligase, cytoplasmic [Auxenochlorella protothecoides]